MVVIHKTLGIILIVEVKKPEKDIEESRAPRRPRKASSAAKRVKEEQGVFESEFVAGQVYDHLQGMINLGNATCRG